MDIRKWLVSSTSARPSSDLECTTITLPFQPAPPIQSDITETPVGSNSETGANGAEAEFSNLQAVDDLGIDQPNQVKLKQYPARMFGGKKRAFVSSWYINRDWLEYSVKADSAFCFCCRKFNVGTSRVDAFVNAGYRNWKNANETDRGFHKHQTSKEHLSSYAMWKERERRVSSGKEISTLLNADQLQKNRYYVSSIIDVIGFLVENQLPLRGKLDAFDNMSEGGSGLFLSLLDYTIKKDPLLADAVKTLPRNATYTCHDIQNEIISLLSEVVTEAIVKEVGDSYYTLKVDGTRDPTGCENISIVIRFVNESESYEVAERLLTVATAEMGDARTLTDTILAELNKAGLNPSKILSQVYDGASLMSGKIGGVQKLLQEKLNKNIPYVHCLNHQLHLVVVHAMSAEAAVMDFFNVCNALYKYCKKPTIAVHYKGERLKRLLEQRWTGHLATVSVILNNFEEITSLLTEIDSVRAHGPELRMEAVGLLREISTPSFLFIANLVHEVLALLDPPNKLLQREDTDLWTGLSIVTSAKVCMQKLRCVEGFTKVWEKARAAANALPKSTTPKRRRTGNKNMDDYLVEETTGQREDDVETELKRLYYSTVDSVVGEMDQRFSEQNSHLYRALAVLDPESDLFLDPETVKCIMDLTQSPICYAEFEVAKNFLRSQKESKTEGDNWTTKLILSKYHKALQTMPSVLTAFKHALTFGASTAMCENSFSSLRNVFSDHRRSMLHKRKAQLVQLAFERDLTRKCTTEWKDTVLRRFNVRTRRLQLFKR
ncbi:Zinc finger MYM-type protein 1 [Labeo rohita]|uniref:Zinc finger MYM-type protein 1 n=4 Tax=Labeo rohita TaxID=84645 RepID=A0ABQ8L3B2_LABRO|nr:Zinc finger MYM-type protein 1 [Labeo rohita]